MEHEPSRCRRFKDTSHRWANEHEWRGNESFMFQKSWHFVFSVSTSMLCERSWIQFSHSFCATHSTTMTTLKSHFKATAKKKCRAASSHWFFKDTKTLLWFRFTMNKKRIVQTEKRRRKNRRWEYFKLSIFFCSALFFASCSMDMMAVGCL